MNGWNLFQQITAALDTPLRASVDGIIDQLFPNVQQILVVMMTIWIALLGYSIGFGRLRDSNAMSSMLNGFVYAAVIAAFLTAEVYHNNIEAIAFNVPNQISALIGGGDFGANSFDGLFGRAWTDTLRVSQGIGISIRLYWIYILLALFIVVAGAAVMAGFGIWLMSHIALSLIVAVGPLFMLALLFSYTRPFFDRFVGAIVAIGVLQILVAALITLLIDTQIAMMQALTAPDTDSPLPGVRLLIAAGMLYALAAWLLKQIWGVAWALAGGVHLTGGQAAVSATLGRVNSALRSLAGGAGRAVSGAPSAVRQAAARPPGASLSGP